MKSLNVLSVLLVAAVIGGSSAAARPQEEPRVKKTVQPSYPTILKAAGIEGTVWVKVFVNEEGKVDKVELMKADNKDFVPTVMEAVRQWEFDPATKDGKPIKAEVSIPFTFKMDQNLYKAKNEILLALVEEIKRFLRGGPADSVKAHTAPKSYAVIGNRYEPLLPLISERAKLRLLVEGKDTGFHDTHTILDDSEDAACMLMATRPGKSKFERYHTVVFMKSSDGRWLIQAWQTSF